MTNYVGYIPSINSRESFIGITLASLAPAPLPVACYGDKPNLAMPKVEGLPLDAARAGIKRAGFSGDAEVIGGGVFGIVREKNWAVCTQVPAAGQPMDKAPQLTVARDCSSRLPSSTVSSSGAATFPAMTSTPRVGPTAKRLTAKDEELSNILAMGHGCAPEIECESHLGTLGVLPVASG